MTNLTSRHIIVAFFSSVLLLTYCTNNYKLIDYSSNNYSVNNNLSTSEYSEFDLRKYSELLDKEINKMDLVIISTPMSEYEKIILNLNKNLLGQKYF